MIDPLPSITASRKYQNDDDIGTDQKYLDHASLKILPDSTLDDPMFKKFWQNHVDLLNAALLKNEQKA